MDLFTIDNVGQAELLDRNTNEDNSVKFVRNVDVLNEVGTQDVNVEKIEDTEEEEDENLSDVDFGGKWKCNLAIEFEAIFLFSFPFQNYLQTYHGTQLIFRMSLSCLNRHKRVNSNRIWINFVNCWKRY